MNYFERMKDKQFDLMTKLNLLDDKKTLTKLEKANALAEAARLQALVKSSVWAEISVQQRLQEKEEAEVWLRRHGLQSGSKYVPDGSLQHPGGAAVAMCGRDLSGTVFCVCVID